MTEQEWLKCTDPANMLEVLKNKASHRRFRLLLCAWSRLNWDWLPKQSCSAVEMAELFVDGLASDADRKLADAELWQATLGVHNSIRDWLARLTLAENIDMWEAAHSTISANPRVKSRQTTVLCDIFGNPFRPIALNPAWLAWNDGTVRKIAQSIYEERAFDRLPILADALTDAGCDHADILNHCRSEGLHVKGCWVVDLLTGRQ